MAQSQKTRKTARPRLDAIIRHIKAGSYDGDIGEIRAAIEARNEVRKEAVLKTVQEVFGEKYTVTASEDRGSSIAEDKPARRSRPGGPVDPELAAAEEAALQREAELERESQKSVPESDPEGSPDIESRSPMIGSIGGSAQPE